MASGHVNRIQRPNTWLHRPSLQREISLANAEPSTHGTFRTSRNVRLMSVYGAKADMTQTRRDVPMLPIVCALIYNRSK